MNYVKDAEQHFGITQYKKEAFYIMPDGKWLDGSGRHWDNSIKPNSDRSVDHFDVLELDWLSHTDRLNSWLEFMRLTNAARCDMVHGIFGVMNSSSKYYPILVNSFCKGAKGKYVAMAIYDKSGHIVAEIEFNNAQPKKMLAWLQEHYQDKPTKIQANTMKKITAEIEALDTIIMDLPLTMRLFELCRESIKDDIHLHTLTTALLDLRTQKECLTMDDYPAILKMADIKPEEPETQEALEDISEDY